MKKIFAALKIERSILHFCENEAQDISWFVKIDKPRLILSLYSSAYSAQTIDFLALEKNYSLPIGKPRWYVHSLRMKIDVLNMAGRIRVWWKPV